MTPVRKPGTLVMHIGPHKTATSYLQHNFDAHRARLLEAGWLYPRTGERVRTAHHDISDLRADLMSDDTPMVQELRQIGTRAKREGANILLSSEGFRHWRPKHYERLRDLTQTPHLHIAYTLRDPLDLLYAQWAQKVKNGSDQSLPEMFRQHFTDVAKSPLLNPMLDLPPVLALPDVTATILRYDAIVARQQDIFTVFMEQVLGLSGFAAIPSPSRNQRLPVELTEFIRALQPLAGLEQSKTRIKLGQAFELFLPEPFKQEIVDTIREHAADARLVMEVRRADLGLPAIDAQIIAAFGPLLYPPLEGNRPFERETAAWVHYDAEALRQNPLVRQLMEQALRRTSQDSLWVRTANAGFAALIGLRRLRKRLRL